MWHADCKNSKYCSLPIFKKYFNLTLVAANRVCLPVLYSAWLVGLATGTTHPLGDVANYTQGNDRPEIVSAVS